jgi:hypothetical protein
VNSGPSVSSIDVVTYHYDNGRTGQNLKETVLNPANVNSTKFGKLGELMVDGLVDAQPLYLSNVAIPNQATRNILYAVTEHGSVYAFDADSTSSTPLWKISTLLNGEVPSDDRGCGQVTPEIGITSTPVIDRSRGHLCHRHVQGWQRQLFSALARIGPRHRQRTFRRAGDHQSDLSGRWREQLRRKRGF